VSNPRTAVERAMNALAASLPPYWGNVRFDGVTMQGALHYLRTRQPRVLYVMLGDTDEWAHERRYDLYLDAINRSDRFIRTLWQTVQAMPEYRGRTALLLATDHGRGSGSDWTDHGRDVPAAGRIWMAALRPEAFSRQPSAISGSYTQSQFAATVAGLLGLEGAFRGANPKAAPSIFTP
jgi:phosphopentomutase